MTKFILVGTQRSGTTLLRSALDGHPEILCLGEVFYLNKGVRKKGNPSMGKDLSTGFASWRARSYQAYMEKSVLRYAGHWLFRGRMTRKYLDSVYATEGCGAVGFKMMANQLRKFPEVLPYIKYNGVSVVHMLRENPLDIMLSRLSLMARGYAHSAAQAGEAVTIHIPTDTLVSELRAIRDEGLRWRSVFEASAPYMRVTYERFVQDRQAVSQELLSFLGVDPNIELKSELVKLNASSISDVISNIEDVRSCLNKSEFNWCIS